MSRLTKRLGDQVIVKWVGTTDCGKICDRRKDFDNPCDECPVDDAFRKLAHYEDMAEAGRLITLPCAVGDTMYFVGEYGIGGVKEYEVGCIVLKGNADYSRRLWEDVYGGDLGGFEDIGETVFLSKEEAEAKLKELEND